MKYLFTLLLIICAMLASPLAAQTEDAVAPLVLLDAHTHDLSLLPWYGCEGFSVERLAELQPGGHRVIELPRFPLRVQEIFRPGPDDGQEYILFTKFGVAETWLQTGSSLELAIPAIGQGWQIYLNGTLLAGSPRPGVPGGVFTGLRVPVAAGLLQQENLLAVRIVAAPGSLPVVDNTQAGLLFSKGMVLTPAAITARFNIVSMLAAGACLLVVLAGLLLFAEGRSRRHLLFISLSALFAALHLLCRPPLMFDPGAVITSRLPWVFVPFSLAALVMYLVVAFPDIRGKGYSAGAAATALVLALAGMLLPVSWLSVLKLVVLCAMIPAAIDFVFYQRNLMRHTDRLQWLNITAFVVLIGAWVAGLLLDLPGDNDFANAALAALIAAHAGTAVLRQTLVLRQRHEDVDRLQQECSKLRAFSQRRLESLGVEPSFSREVLVLAFAIRQKDESGSAGLEVVKPLLHQVLETVEHPAVMIKLDAPGKFSLVFPEPDCSREYIAETCRQALKILQNWGRLHSGYEWGLGLHASSLTGEMVSAANADFALCDSDALLVAPRLASLCQHYNTQFLFSDECAEMFRQPRKKTVREVDRVRIKGRQDAMVLCDLVTTVKKQTVTKQPVEELAQAIALYNEGKLTRARTVFRRLRKQNPDDPIVRKYLEKLEKSEKK